MSTALYQFTYTPDDTDEVANMVNALLGAYVSASALARALDVLPDTVYYWQRGGSPQLRHIERIDELYAHLVGSA